MKQKIAAGLLCAALCLALAGCTSGAGQNLGRFVTDRETQLGHTSVPPTEVETYTDGAFADVLGFNVNEVPNTPAVAPTKFFTIDGWFGQVEFLTDAGEVLVLRVAPEDGKRLEPTYTESHNASDETRTVGEIEVRTRLSDAGCCMITWSRDGYQYLLHSNVKQGRPDDAVVDAIVQGTRSSAVE